jgi:hypothetical protein
MRTCCITLTPGRVDPLAADRISPLDEDRWLALEKEKTSS